MIVWYAPINYADDTFKNEFYDSPQSVIDSIQLQDLTCLAVDLKAKVGQDRFYCLGVMGHWNSTGLPNIQRLLSEFGSSALFCSCPPGEDPPTMVSCSIIQFKPLLEEGLQLKWLVHKPMGPAQFALEVPSSFFAFIYGPQVKVLEFQFMYHQGLGPP